MEFSKYYYKMRQCFMGKCIGGTLGMPFEGVTEMLNLTYYEPVPSQMVGNDDLDLQVIWLDCIRRRGLPINSHYLAEGWLENIRSVWDEYGVAQRNLRKKIYPPLSGAYDNKFSSGFGAAIRTEIWAALAPGNPDLAVRFAVEDSTVDHSDEGVEASKFIAAIESLAYTEKDVKAIYEKAVSYVDKNSRLYHAVQDAKEWAETIEDVTIVRDMIVDKYGVQNFTDVSLNIAFVVLGLFSGKGDFDKTICNTVNCGYDTDCTAGIVGAIMGLLYPDCIDKKWTMPIGDELVLSLYMVGTHQPKSIDEMCMQIASICCDVQDYYETGITITGAPDFLISEKHIHAPWRKKDFSNLNLSRNTSVLKVTPMYVAMKYPIDTAIALGNSAKYTLELISEIDDTVQISLFMPYGFKLSTENVFLELKANELSKFEFEISASYFVKHNYTEVIDIEISGKHNRVRCSAGIPVKDEWLVAKVEKESDLCCDENFFKNAQSIMAENHFIKIPKGIHYLAIDFKSPNYINDAILVAEGNRKIKLWLDGKLILKTEDDWYVPASHRGKGTNLNCRPRINIMPKWHNVVIEVLDGEGDEIFFGIFKPYGHEWLEDIETKKAFV